MKRLDSYRLLDLLLMVLCTGLGIIFTFLISLGYNEISKYFVEIIDFPYFVAFLPSFLASFIHAGINYLAGIRFGHNLIDLTKTTSKRHHNNAFYIALAGLVVAITFFILFINHVLYSEEYIYVLILLPVGLLPFAYLFVIEIINIVRSRMGMGKKILYLSLCILVGVIPVSFGLATYLPGVLGWSYLGISMFPLAYVIGDAVSMEKFGADIDGDDDF